MPTVNETRLAGLVACVIGVWMVLFPKHIVGPVESAAPSWLNVHVVAGVGLFLVALSFFFFVFAHRMKKTGGL